MRRFVVPGVVLGLLLSPAASAGLGLPQPTCASDPSFGVHIDEEARALGALDEIYMDGAVAVPIRLGLTLSTIQRMADLVDRGLVIIDITGPDGAVLPGKLELAPSTEPTAGVGQPAWLVWVGEQPFEPNTNYELEYSFVNDKISTCPEAVPTKGILPFSTGEGSAQAKLDGVSLSFTAASLSSQLGTEAGCCSAPESKPCVDEGKCVACWTSFFFVGQAQALVAPPLPVSYFAIDVSLQAGDVEQIRASEPGESYATFRVTDSAPEYCFEARLRPRAPLDAGVSSSKCLPSADVLKGTVTLPFTALPIADCAEAPQLSQAGPYDVAQAMFGKSEEEAQTTILQLTTPPGPGLGPVTPPTTTVSSGERGGCAAARGTAGGSGAAWLVALLLLSRRRR